MDVFNTVLYGGVVPAALALAFAGLAFLQAARGHSCRRLAAWVVPLASAGGLGLAWAMRFSDDVGRWQWIIPASLALLLLWPMALFLWPAAPRRVLAVSAGAAILLALAAAGLMWPTFYDAQPLWMHLLPPIAAGLMAAALYPAAVKWAGPAEALAVAAAGALLVSPVLFSGNAMFAELLMPVVTAGGVAALLALVIRGERWRQWREGISAGTLALALVFPQFAVLAWSNGYDLTPQHAWSLLLPSAAALLIWLTRIPPLASRPLVAGILSVVLVAALAAAGLLLALSVTDTAAYDSGF